MDLSLRVRLIWVKWTCYEYWPVWFLFFPAIIYAIILGIRSRSLTYFTAANPGIDLGGFFGESKSEILKMVDDKFKPRSCLVIVGENQDEALLKMQQQEINFPVVAKPDKGERGNGVVIVKNGGELMNYHHSSRVNYIIQEQITDGIELGVLYFRMPDGSKSGITSVVKKEYLTIVGNGKDTIEELMKKSDRAAFQIIRIRRKLNEELDRIPGLGEQVVLERVGNHSRGTKFLDGRNLINQTLVKIFDEIASSMKGFYFGRFDLKVSSLEDLYNGTNIRIMEVNGTTSEPAHIYDPSLNLLEAQRDILFHTKLVYRIARMNNKLGIKYTPVREAWKVVLNHFSHKQHVS
jgi:hypothetical protein